MAYVFFFLQQYFRELCLEIIKTKLNDTNPVSLWSCSDF